MPCFALLNKQQQHFSSRRRGQAHCHAIARAVSTIMCSLHLVVSLMLRAFYALRSFVFIAQQMMGQQRRRHRRRPISMLNPNDDVERGRVYHFHAVALCVQGAYFCCHTHRAHRAHKLRTNRSNERTNSATNGECRATVVSQTAGSAARPSSSKHAYTFSAVCFARLSCIQFTCSLRYTFLFAWE